MLRFRQMKNLQKFASARTNAHNHFNSVFSVSAYWTKLSF